MTADLNKTAAGEASLTDEEIDDLWDESSGYCALYEEVRKFARLLLSRVNG
jgi:hypothetical protein